MRWGYSEGEGVLRKEPEQPKIIQLGTYTISTPNIDQLIDQGNFPKVEPRTWELKWKNSTEIGTVVELALVDFGPNIRNTKAADWIKTNMPGWQPANIQHLLTFAADPRSRQMQLNHSIVALGSTAETRESTFVPYVDRFGQEGGRRLDVYTDFIWEEETRFLVARVVG